MFEIWRDRLFDAFVAEVGQRGLAEVNVERVCLLAGVSTSAFYKVFEGGKTTCAAQAFRCGSDIVCKSAEIAFARITGPWEARLHAAVSTMLDLLASNPNFARLGIVEMSRDPDGRQPFREVVYRCRKAFGGPRQLEVPGISDVDVPTFETALVGAALGPLECAVLEGRSHELPKLATTITYSLALPLVGHERAIHQVRQLPLGP